MLNNIYELEDSVDVYVSYNKDLQKNIILFYKITTRDRIEISTSQDVVDFLALIDGEKILQQILLEQGNFSSQAAFKLLDFLLGHHIVRQVNKSVKVDSRYKRQIAYFHDFILGRTGEDSQRLLSNKKIVVFGCGSVNSAIAETLVRMGVSNVILIDYKDVSIGMMDRNLFLCPSDIGKGKAQALAEYLWRIDKSANICVIKAMLCPDTDLSKLIPDDYHIVINECNEPYIGHTSLKIGRYLQDKNIALYVTGGFDAHLMSSGELVYPPYTPCITCIQQTFEKALVNWVPTYSNTYSTDQKNENNIDHDVINNFFVGGAGGTVTQSYFSAYLACIRILQFLLEDTNISWKTVRYEYLTHSGELTEFELNKQQGCNICGR